MILSDEHQKFREKIRKYADEIVAPRAIELDKNHYDSWIFMNITYSLMGDKLNAMKAFEKAIKINPSMEDAWNNLAKIYFYHHKYDIALSCIDKALLISPARAKTIRNKAVLLGKMGRFQEKKTILEAAIKKFPDDPYIAYSLGHCYFDKKNYKTALIYFKKAMTKAKEEEDNDIKLIATGMVGYSHWKLGENDKALTIYNDIIENYPFYAKGYYISAAIYASMGNINKAVEFLKKTIEIDDGYRDIAREDPDIAPIKNTDEFRKLVGGK